MADFTPYTTKNGDRWDSIAYMAYGDASLMCDIIEANQDVPIYNVLPGNITIKIPIRELETQNVDSLPSWKQ